MMDNGKIYKGESGCEIRSFHQDSNPMTLEYEVMTLASQYATEKRI